MFNIVLIITTFLILWIVFMYLFSLPFIAITVPILCIPIILAIKNVLGKVQSHGAGKIEIDDQRKSIKFDDKEIRLVDIANISVNDDIEGISTSEKFLVKGTQRLHFSEIVLTLKNGFTEKIPTARKSILYKTLKKLNTYIKIDYDIEQYKEPFANGYEIIILIIIIIMCFITFMK